jgi:hypothetical protein
MRSVFEVTVEQDVSINRVYRPETQVYEIGAVNAVIATNKALRLARQNGFMKSRPLEVVKVVRVIRHFE